MMNIRTEIKGARLGACVARLLGAVSLGFAVHLDAWAQAAHAQLQELPVAQQAYADGKTEVQREDGGASTVVVRTPAPRRVQQFEGFGAMSLQDIPASIGSYEAGVLHTAGVQRLADITKLDAAVTDSYNAVGYWDFLNIRGFTLDARNNYRREGLPISGETIHALDNKERIDILKGTSGMQSGIGAPGGVVNYVLKRPPTSNVRAAHFALTARGGRLAGMDMGGRFAAREDRGYRLVAVHERLRPETRHTNAERKLLSLALEQRIGGDAQLDAEMEYTRRAQPSQAGFSLLGSVLPAVEDVKTNLNNQGWTQPVVTQGLMAGLRFIQALNASWTWTAQWGTQRLHSDDYMAFPFGCSASGEYTRYCANGTYDIYDYRSVGERRDNHALRLKLDGTMRTGGVAHVSSVGLMRVVQQENMPRNTNNLAGVGNVQASLAVPSSAVPTNAGVVREERTWEWFASDHMQIEQWRLSAGVRHARLQRSSNTTDGNQPIAYRQSMSAPWVAVSYQLAQTMIYWSVGEGLQSYVTPHKNSAGAAYTTPGAVLPVQKSHQTEWGIRSHRPKDLAQDASGQPAAQWGITFFEIKHPRLRDSAPDYGVDGLAVHKGVEGQWAKRLGRMHLGLTGMVLQARVQEALLDATRNGLRPVNVPNRTAKVQLGYAPWGKAGVQSELFWVYEGARAVLEDNTLMLPSWHRLDAALSWTTHWHVQPVHLRVGVDNLLNRRYWRESPTQFGHIYLYPGNARALRLSAQMHF